MAEYEKEYLQLFNSITDATKQLEKLRQKCLERMPEQDRAAVQKEQEQPE